MTSVNINSIGTMLTVAVCIFSTVVYALEDAGRRMDLHREKVDEACQLLSANMEQVGQKASGPVDEVAQLMSTNMDQVDQKANGPVDEVAQLMSTNMDQVDQKANGPVDEVDKLVMQVVFEELDGCHLVLLTAGSVAPLLYHTLKLGVGVVQVEAQTVMSVEQSTQDRLFHEMFGEAKFSCRAVFVFISNNSDTNLMLSLLEATGLWRNPETHVVVVGGGTEVHKVLLHHSLRNTLHALYLALHANTFPRLTLKSPSTSLANRHGRECDGRCTKDRQREEDGVAIYRRCLYCLGGDPGVKLLFHWHPHTAHLHPPLFVKSPEDLLGHQFRVVVRRYFPTIDFERVGVGADTLAAPRDSINTRMLQDMASKLNFTYELHEAWDGDWGTEDSNGNWSGLVGTLQHQLADFSTTITPTSARLRVMDHSMIYASDPFVIVSAKSQPLGHSLALLKPFARSVWVVVAGSCIAGGVVLWLLQNAWAWVTDGRSVRFSIAFFYISSLLIENPPSDPPKHSSARVFVGWWMLTCLVITAAYRSSLSAHLTVGEKMAPVDTFEDLVRQKGWRWGSEVLLGPSILYFSLSSDPTLQKIYSMMETHKLDENMELVVGGRYAFITTKFQNYYVVASRYTDRFGRCTIHISGRSYPKSAGTSWGFRKGAPFRRRITAMTQWMIEAGLINHWLRDVITTRVLQERSVNPDQYTAHPAEMDEELTPLNLEHLKGVFLLLGLCYSLATLVLLGELFLEHHGLRCISTSQHRS